MIDAVVLPRNALVVLVGPAGCGKTMFARTRFLRTQVVSIDECRALVSDSEDDPRAAPDAFRLMYAILDARLKRGRLSVADATSVTAEKRAALLAIAFRHRRPAVAVVFDVPPRVCQSRNSAREGRRVPPQAIGGQFKRMRASLPTLADEGFSAVWVLGENEVERVGVSVMLPAADRPATLVPDASATTGLLRGMF